MSQKNLEIKVTEIPADNPDLVAEENLSLFQSFKELLIKNLTPYDKDRLLAPSLEKLSRHSFSFFFQSKNDPDILILTGPSYLSDLQDEKSCLFIRNLDRPFLLDSTLEYFRQNNLTPDLIAHPVIRVQRTKALSFAKIYDDVSDSDQECACESLIIIELKERLSPQKLADVKKDLTEIYRDVRAAVEDWSDMRAEISTFSSETAHKKTEEFPELTDFINWLINNHFTFLGSRSYRLEDGKVLHEKGLGILRNTHLKMFEGDGDYLKIGNSLAQKEGVQRLLLITKSSVLSRVHRAVPLDVIRLLKVDAQEKIIGEQQFFGLFTSSAYSQSAKDIPLLRKKLQNALELARFPLDSHDGKALVHIVETLPRDILFQISDKELYDVGISILQLQERQRLVLFVRKDPFEHMVSCLLYVPKDHYNASFIEKTKNVLSKTFSGALMSWQSLLSDLAYARVSFFYSIPSGHMPNIDVEKLENTIFHLSLTWSDQLQNALIKIHGESDGNRLFVRYKDVFPSSYQEKFTQSQTIEDILHIEKNYPSTTLNTESSVTISMTESPYKKNLLHIKVYNPKNALALSDVLPIFECLGLSVHSEETFKLKISEHETIWIHDFETHLMKAGSIELAEIKGLFEETFLKIHENKVDLDKFNKLTLLAGMPWRDISVLRSISSYLWQIQFPYSQDFVAETLTHNPELSLILVGIFHYKFDPKIQESFEARNKKNALLVQAFEEKLGRINSLDEDKIFRRYLDVIQAMVRTNFYQSNDDGSQKEAIAFKIDSKKIPGIPLPCPKYEVFIYAVRMEGIHLRGGAVARGGIRFSDRREDFRREILGLFKTQTVKNGVIVPVGAKGGFVGKLLPDPSDRDVYQREVVSIYTLFIETLLDITDNLKSGSLVPPENVLRYDGDDPYLVVAADKGTATFSDTANAISLRRGFWLGDAFASGGSNGYDHKKIGITARGAWVSVTQHFWEKGIDITEKSIRVVGVGDMAGDVFGNGMLLNDKMKLVVAFNHQHIFLDPNPNPQASFQERKRLFNLPRSTWNDYDKSIISEGGGVFERSLKSIPLSKQVQEILGTTKEMIEPDILIQELLKSSYDLLYLGGIGTFIKSSAESHADVGDRHNDRIRVDATDLKCHVIGEGANLGVTQKARVAYALQGGRINMDAIDNSGGVDCSDHEVNLKILLNLLMEEGQLTVEDRNKLLGDVQEDIAKHVLRDNTLQTRTLSIVEYRGVNDLESQQRFINFLENLGILNRSLESLPSDKVFAERKAEGIGLVRPELAILLSYTKIFLKEELLKSSLLDDDAVQDVLNGYFPPLVLQKTEKLLKKHPLRRELVGLCLSNMIIARTGVTFIHDVMERLGVGAVDVVHALLIVFKVFHIETLFNEVEALQGQISARLENKLYHEIIRFLRRTTLWFLHHGEEKSLNLNQDSYHFSLGVQEFLNYLTTYLTPEDHIRQSEKISAFEQEGLSSELAQKFGYLELIGSSCHIVYIAQRVENSISEIAPLYFEIGEHIGLNWLRNETEKIIPKTHWEKLVIGGIIDDLYVIQSQLTETLLGYPKELKVAISKETVASWLHAQKDKKQRLDKIYADFKLQGSPDISMLLIAIRHLKQF